MENTENPTSFNQFVDRHAKAIGILLALSTGIMFAINDALVKVFSVNFVDAVMVRCVIQTLVAGSIMVCLGLCKSSAIFKKKNPEEANNDSTSTKSKYFLFAIILLQVNYKFIIHFVKDSRTKFIYFQGFINASVIFTCYIAYSNMPIGDAIAIVFSCPAFTLLSTFMILGHRHSLWKIIFALIVIIGVVMIIQPPFLFGSNSDNSENNADGNRLLGVLMAITAAILSGFQSAILHYLSHIHSIILVFWTGVIGILECLVFAFFYNEGSMIFSGNYLNFSFEFVWQLFVMAIIGTVALILTTKAYQLLDPTICVVLASQEVLLDFMIQAFFFKDPVGIWNILGGSLVLISGICISSEAFFMEAYQKVRGQIKLSDETDNA